MLHKNQLPTLLSPTHPLRKTVAINIQMKTSIFKKHLIFNTGFSNKSTIHNHHPSLTTCAKVPSGRCTTVSGCCCCVAASSSVPWGLDWASPALPEVSWGPRGCCICCSIISSAWLSLLVFRTPVLKMDGLNENMRLVSICDTGANGIV